MMVMVMMKKIVRRLGMSVVAETVLYICISVLELTTETRVCATLPRLSHLCTGRVHFSLRCGLQSCHISSHYSLIISSWHRSCRAVLCDDHLISLPLCLWCGAWIHSAPTHVFIWRFANSNIWIWYTYIYLYIALILVLFTCQLVCITISVASFEDTFECLWCLNLLLSDSWNPHKVNSFRV